MKRYPYVVIGAGAGGLALAIGLAKLKRRVLLIEKGEYGGDCTNVGCIPSKALIAAAEVAHAVRHASDLGIEGLAYPEASGALEYVRDVVERVRSKETPPELEKLGVDTLSGSAYFLDANHIVVKREEGDVKVQAKKIVIAAGSEPCIPDVEGLAGAPYLTNETLFDLKKLPKRLAVLGGGAIGCELAQAMNRLGVEVTLIHPHRRLLDKEEPLASLELDQVFHKEGLIVKAPGHLKKVAYDSHFHLTLDDEEIEVDELLIATGRSPSVFGYGLEKTGIRFSEEGIETDPYGRTSVRHIFALGDVRGQAMFTHIAEREARAVLFNLVAPWPFRKKGISKEKIPHVTFTAPEVASIGMSASQAESMYGKKKIAVYDVQFDEVDRAICQGRTEGFVRIVTKKWSSKILGATICSSRAGEVLMEVGTAMAMNIPLRKIAGILHPYPIYNHAIRKAADQWLTKTIFRKS